MTTDFLKFLHKLRVYSSASSHIIPMNTKHQKYVFKSSLHCKSKKLSRRKL